MPPANAALQGAGSAFTAVSKVVARSARLAPLSRQIWMCCWLALGVGFWLRAHHLTALPPVAHYDEAANGVLVGDIAFRGYRPIFITSYTGKEVLFFYLAAGLAHLLGNTIFSLRLTSVFIGLLTLAATFRLGRELFPRSAWIGALSALILATLFPHLIFSRLGFRAISQPLLQSLALGGLLVGLRRQSWRSLAVGGAALGLTAYTYLASRLFPLVALTAAVVLVWRQPRRRWAQVGAWLSVGGLAALPLLLYFARHPDVFWTRIGQVSAESPTFATYAAAYLKALGLFFVRGDPYWRFNLPDRPIFTGLLALAWPIGAVWLLWDWRRPRAARAFPGAITPVLVLGAPLIMLLPTALAVNDILPSFLRAIGVFPFVVFPVAYAAANLGARWQAWWQVRRPTLARQPWPAVVALIWLAVGGWAAYRAYFQAWGSRSDVFYAADADLGAVAAFLDDRDVPGESIYVAAIHYRHPTLAFTSRRYAELKWLLEGEALVQPARGPALIVYPHSAPPPAWAQALLPPPSLSGPSGPDGLPTFTAYALTEPLPFAPTYPLAVNFGDVIRLRGYDLATASGAATLRLYWEVTGAPPGNFNPFIHIVGDDGFRWAQADSIAYLGEQWAVGERIVQSVTATLPAGMPPGLYRVYVGLFDGAQRLSVLDEGGRYAGPSYRLEGVPLPGNLAWDGSRPPVAVDGLIAPGLTFMGYEKGGDSAETGAPYTLTLWWQINQPQPRLSAQLTLTAPDGQVFEWVAAPFPWRPPAFVHARLPLRVPADLPGGAYALRLTLADDQAGQAIAAFDLGWLTLIPTARSYSPPPMIISAEATFGDEIALLGYSLASQADGLQLTLVWRALIPPGQDYTVFIHRLRPDGSCCLWQSDAAPRQGSYPTTRWLESEVVADTYLIPADPPGPLRLEIGLYLPDNGRRLPVAVPGQPTRDFYPLTLPR